MQNRVIGKKVSELGQAARQNAWLSAARPDKDASAAPDLTERSFHRCVLAIAAEFHDRVLRMLRKKYSMSRNPTHDNIFSLSVWKVLLLNEYFP
jgi:hypothetical protein